MTGTICIQPRCPVTDGGHEVLFEETMSLRDEAGASSLISKTHLLFAGLVVISVAAVGYLVVTTVSSAASAVGGMDELGGIIREIYAASPFVAVGVFVLVLVIVGWFVLSIVGMGRRLKTSFDERIHTRVTDSGLTVERDGSRRGQSDRVEVPFDAIATVEHLDTDASSMRVEPGDVSAEKFFAGRSQSWVHIGRDADRAVYVGSDRPRELAETVARNAPHVGRAEPY